MKDEVSQQRITVEKAEKWMDRPIKVSLTLQVTEKTSTSQTFYVNVGEAEVLMEALSGAIDSLDGF